MVSAKYLIACVSLAASAAFAAVPVLTTFPTVSSSTIVADNTTQYTVTMTVSDGDGYNDIRIMSTLFNLTESGWVFANGRGQLAWAKTDGDITYWGGSWTLANATGGGRWGYDANWGTTTYMTPLACQMTVSGSASGGTGSRTVTWAFTAKPAWAYNPVMNDADAWFGDGTAGGVGTFEIGWLDNPNSFDVVAAPCSNTCTTPQAPVTLNLTSTGVSLQINPSDSGVDLFCLRISPGVGDKIYIQPDGTIGATPQWRTRSNWGVVNVTGLLPRMPYSFSARASRSVSGDCPSTWGANASITTLGDLPVLNPYQGTAFSPWVRGQCPYRNLQANDIDPVWNLTIGSMGRGLAGGLDADTYDWRNIYSGSTWGLGGGYPTTLQFLQYARDHNAIPMITANMFGGGYLDPNQSNSFVCVTDNPQGLAADWVRYTNTIAQNYRQGGEGGLTGENLRVYNSISNWGGKPLLPAPAEAAVPKVQYWEIGNEPELGAIGGMLVNHYLGPNDYRDRYKAMAQAMRAVDPTIKVGPCLMNPADPGGSGLWLTALAADPTATVNFISYHPYYWGIRNMWGNWDGVTSALRDFKAFLKTQADGSRAVMTQYGRTGYELFASEWNAVNWDSPGALQSSMANGMAVAEACFSFAQDGVTGATFWEQPQDKQAVKDVFAELVANMGDVLVTTSTQMGYTPANSNFRIYVTRRQSDPSRVMIWGLDFDENLPVTVEMGMNWCTLNSATLRRYGKPGTDAAGGDTSLSDTSGLAWEQTDVPSGFNINHFSLTLEDAEITLLILNITPIDSDGDGVGDFFDQCPGTIPGIPVDANGCPQAVPGDFDRDGDVDQSDFGRMQICLSGSSVPQLNPSCAAARLDGDDDVDQADVTKLLNCMSGSDVPASPTCAN